MPHHTVSSPTPTPTAHPYHSAALFLCFTCFLPSGLLILLFRSDQVPSFRLPGDYLLLLVCSRQARTLPMLLLLLLLMMIVRAPYEPALYSVHHRKSRFRLGKQKKKERNLTISILNIRTHEEYV